MLLKFLIMIRYYVGTAAETFMVEEQSEEVLLQKILIVFSLCMLLRLPKILTNGDTIFF